MNKLKYTIFCLTIAGGLKGEPIISTIKQTAQKIGNTKLVQNAKRFLQSAATPSELQTLSCCAGLLGAGTIASITDAYIKGSTKKILKKYDLKSYQDIPNFFIFHSLMITLGNKKQTNPYLSAFIQGSLVPISFLAGANTYNNSGLLSKKNNIARQATKTIVTATSTKLCKNYRFIAATSQISAFIIGPLFNAK